MKNQIEDYMTPQELSIWKSLDTPPKIQAFLDGIPYSPEYRARSPLSVIRDNLAHCFDGSMFAAAALRRLGYPPLILDMFPEPGTDDDHILAIFRQNNRYGAIAKSNFSGLRYREPIYRSIRELVMSYFEDFFNMQRMKTLRFYTRPTNLGALDNTNWEWNDGDLYIIVNRLNQLKRLPVITSEMADTLLPVDDLSFRSGTLGLNPEGVYKPKK